MIPCSANFGQNGLFFNRKIRLGRIFLLGHAKAMGIGRKLRERRIALGLQQKAVAAEAKVSQAYLSDIELERTVPSLGMLARIARVLGMPILAPDLEGESPEAVGEPLAPYGPDRPLLDWEKTLLADLRDRKLKREVLEHVRRYKIAKSGD